MNDGRELIDIYRRVKALGVTTSIDMSLPDPQSESGQVEWGKVLAGLLPYVDIAPLSAEEAMFMLNRPRFDELKRDAAHGEPLDVYTNDDFLQLGRKLLAFGAGIVPLKCGHRGMFLFTAAAERLAAMGAAAPSDLRAWANRILWEEAFLVEEVASATGSGDSSIAGLLAAFLRGCSPEQTLKTACCTGAQNVMVLDAISGIHTWEETQAMLPAWPKRRQTAGAAWSYSTTGRVWKHARDGVTRAENQNSR